MPQSRYFLADTVLTALFVLPDRDLRNLLLAFDRIAEDPRGTAESTGRDWDGHLVCRVDCGRFEIGYIIPPAENGVTITLVRPRQS